MTTAEQHARDDEETIARCLKTSWRNERDWLADCPACGLPFWHRHWKRFTCSDTCRSTYWYRQHIEERRANALARYYRQCAARRVA